MDCSQPTSCTSYRSLFVTSSFMAFSRRTTNIARPYPELRTWKAAVCFITGVENPAQLLLLLIQGWDIELNFGPTCSGCSKSIRCDTKPIVCSTCQLHFHGTCSRLTQSQKGIQGFACFFCSGGAAAQPSTATVTCNSVLPRRCLLCHTKIRHGICPIMCQPCSNLAHGKCSGISRCVANLFLPSPACSLPYTFIPTRHIMATINITHAQNVLPPTINIDCLIFPIALSSTPSYHRSCSCFLCVPSPSSI